MAIALSESADVLSDIPDWKLSSIRQAYRSNMPAFPDDAEKYTIGSFKWTDTEYTPRQLLDNFQQYTPFLFITTQGYLGRDEWMNTVASDEVYWLKGIVTLPRIVVRNDYNAYLSVPVSYKHPIIPYRNGVPDGDPITVKSLLAQNTHSEFVFAEEERHNVYHGPGSGEMMKFGPLQIMDRYDERYLMGHTLCGGRLYHEACVIPIYMPITLSIAAAMQTGCHKHFYKTMLEMYNFVNSVPKEVAFPRFIRECDEIMLYDQKPPEGEYDFLEPSQYVSFNRAKNFGKRQNVPSHLYTSLDIRPEIPVQPRTFKPPAAIANQANRNDKPRMPTPPPGTVSLDQRGGARGSDTNIGQMSRQGYNVVDVYPSEMLLELVGVLMKGVVPEVSTVEMVDISVDVQVRRWPQAALVLSSESGPPLKPRVINKNKAVKPAGIIPISQSLPCPPIVQAHIKPSIPSAHAPQPPPPPSPPINMMNTQMLNTQMLNTHTLRTSRPKEQGNDNNPQKSVHDSMIAELNKRRGSLKGNVFRPNVENISPKTLPKSTKPKAWTNQMYIESDQKSSGKVMASSIPVETYDVIPGPKYVEFPKTCEVKAQPSRTGNADDAGSLAQPPQPPPPPMRRNPPMSTERNLPCITLDDSTPQTPAVLCKITTVADIPTDISSLDCEGIGQCLVLLRLPKHRERFMEEQIDGSLLAELDADIMVAEFGFTRFEARKLIKFSEGWRPSVLEKDDSSI